LTVALKARLSQTLFKSSVARYAHFEALPFAGRARLPGVALDSVVSGAPLARYRIQTAVL
jgi:hypothetical protein